MAVPMILCTAALCAAMAAPALAGPFDPFLGQWQGEGTLVLDDEPAERFRCRLRFREMADGAVFFNGRCATAQAAQSFAYTVHPQSDGAVRAENASEGAQDDPDALPMRLTGALDGSRLRFGDDGANGFALEADAETLRFSLQASGPRGRAVGSADLMRRD